MQLHLGACQAVANVPLASAAYTDDMSTQPPCWRGTAQVGPRSLIGHSPACQAILPLALLATCIGRSSAALRSTSCSFNGGSVLRSTVHEWPVRTYLSRRAAVQRCAQSQRLCAALAQGAVVTQPWAWWGAVHREAVHGGDGGTRMAT
jgi:hypothetical protein